MEEIANGNLELTTLVLNQNSQINDNICHILEKLIKGKTPLAHLYLDETSVTEDGFEMLVLASVKSTVLDTLSCKNCKITLDSPFGWKKIGDAMKQNCSITKLEVSGNNVDDGFVEEMNVELEQNKLIVQYIFPVVRE